MRGTALVVLLCVFAAVAAHVLTEEARARSVAAEEMYAPCGGGGDGGGDCAAVQDPTAATPGDDSAAATDATPSTQP